MSAPLRRCPRASALVGSLAILAALLVAPTTSNVTASAATPACSSATLVVWLNTTGDGTAGSIDYVLNFTNVATHACELVGYPGVSAVTVRGAQLGSAAGRDATHHPATVYLAAGAAANGLNSTRATASVALAITETGNFTDSACRQVTAAGLRVYAPNERASHLVPFPFYACAKTGPVYLHVQAVTPYVSGR